MEFVNLQPLDDNHYRQFLLRVLNDDKNQLALKLADYQDVLNLYFEEQSNRRIIHVQLDMENKVIRSKPYQIGIFDKYLNGELTLLYGETRSERLFSEIKTEVERLKSSSITYNPELFSENIQLFDSISLNPSKENIEILYTHYESTLQAIDKIKGLLNKIEEYKDLYVKDTNILEFNEVSNLFEQNSTVDIYYDSWKEMLNLYNRQLDFIKTALKYETEKCINELQFFGNVCLERDALSLSEFLAKTPKEFINFTDSLPYVAESSPNNLLDYIRANIQGYLDCEYITYSLQKNDLYKQMEKDNSLFYEDSKLEKYLNKLKDSLAHSTLETINQQMKEIYGDKFILFKQEEIEPRALIEKLSPAISLETYSPVECYQYMKNNEVLNKKDQDIKNFWESKCFSILEEYLKQKGIINDYSNLIKTDQEFKELRERIYSLTDNVNDLSKPSIDSAAKQIRQSMNRFSEYAIVAHLDLKRNFAEPEINFKNEQHEQYYNRLRVAHQFILEKLVELNAMDNYIQFVEKGLGNQKEIEHELD